MKPSSFSINKLMMNGLKERRKFLRSNLPADAIRFQSKQNSIVVDPVLNENNDGQFYAQLCTEADENDEQHMEFVEHLYTNDTIQISNIDKIDSGVENVTLVIYENKVDYGRILPDFNIIKEITGLEENMNLNLHVEDANARIHPSSKITKAQFAEAFDELCQQSKGTSEKDRNLLGCLIHNTFGDFCNLPFEAKRKADEMNKNDDDGEENDGDDDEDEEKDSRSSTKNLLEDTAVDVTRRYICKQSRFFTFDQCNNDCTVFLGETVGYFVVHHVRSHGFQSAQNLDVKLKVLIPVNIY